MPINPSELSAKRSIAADRRWAFEPDRTAATSKARQSFMGRFEAHVDPEMKLTPTERAKRAANLRRAYFTDLALKSAQARRGRARKP